MKTGILLEELINIAKKPKTDFALSMNMTPSGLSKILTGHRLPSTKERKMFTEKAAEYFAEAIFSHGCYYKFADIFPVVYDFKYEEDLRWFLIYAIEYALDHDLAADNHINLSFTDRGFYYLGRRAALNVLCVIASDCVLTSKSQPIHVYCFYPMFSAQYLSLFEQVKFTNAEAIKNFTMNYVLDEAAMRAVSERNLFPLLHFITRAQRYFDVNLWHTKNNLGTPFLLVQGRLLILFNEQLDGTPLLLPMVHKNYLSLFLHTLLGGDIKKVTVSGNEAAAFLEDHPHFIPQLIEKGIDAVYSFTSVGYLLEKDEIVQIGKGSAASNAIAALFEHIMTGNTDFIVSIAAMERFGFIGQAVVPLVGTHTFPDHQRMEYMTRLDGYLHDESAFQKMKLIDSKLSNLVVMVAGDRCFVYVTDDTCSRERVHIFSRDFLAPILERESRFNQSHPMGISNELWTSYRSNRFIGY